MSPEMNTG